MQHTLPLAMLIELTQTKTDDSTRRLGQLQSAQTSAQEKLNMLMEYRHEYCVRMQAQMQDGIPATQWQNFQHFITTLDGAIEQQRTVVAQALTRLAQGRADWQHQKRRLNSFGTLAERVRQQQAVVLNRREQRDSDEHAARQFRLRATTVTD